MDSLQSVLFYAFAAVALAGGLITAFATSRSRGAVGLALAALGTGAVLADLSAGFAAILVTLALLAAVALATSVPPAAPTPARNWAGVAAALLFAALAYAAYRGAFHSDRYPGGSFNFSAMGRALLDHDAVGLIALAAALALAFGVAALGPRAAGSRGR